MYNNNNDTSNNRDDDGTGVRKNFSVIVKE